MVTLVGVFCPCCGQRAHTMALETGPQVIRHNHTWTSTDGRKERCRQTWVAVPDPIKGNVDLRPVEGREQTDITLKGAAERWLAEHQRRQIEDFARFFLQPATPDISDPE